MKRHTTPFISLPAPELEGHLFLRSLSEDELAVWGAGGKLVLRSRKFLANFLSVRWRAT